MRRICCVFLTITLAFSALHAQSVRLVNSNDGKLSFAYSLGSLSTSESVVGGSTFVRLSLPEATYTQQVGAPMLPVVNQMIEMPLCDSVSVEVTASVSRISALNSPYPIEPLQPSRAKNDTLPHPLVQNTALYATDALYGLPLASVSKVGVARDRNLGLLTIAPVQYNPVSGELLIYSQIELTVTFHGADIAATTSMKQRYASPAFQPALPLLGAIDAPKDAVSNAPMRYLIVCYSGFRGQMDDFVQWKRRQGFLTDIVYTDQLSSATASDIAAYIKQQYTDATPESPAPTYLLLVGDVAQLPAFDSQLGYGSLDNHHVTDLYYATWTDGDVIPDCYYGRFSAQTVAQLQPQIDKTLLYEQYAFDDPSYLDHAVLIAGVDGGYSGDNAYRYADPTMDYIAYNYVNAANGFTSVSYYKNNTSSHPQGVNVTGSSNTSSAQSNLVVLYNQGMGWVNYSAHGSATSWGTPSFTNSNVNSMTNNGKPSIMIGNCCLTGKFDEPTCFGEALLRKGDNAGAVIYIGGSNSTYWVQDFYWSVGVQNTNSYTYDANTLGSYDRLFHTHGEAFSDWRTTIGAMVYAGNQCVQQGSSNFARYYWEVYHVFGDPSLQPWLSQAYDQTLGASELPEGDLSVTECNLPYGFSQLYVSAAPYAYVALTNSVGPVAATWANAQGEAVLDISSELAIGSYELVSSAPHYKTAFLPVNIIDNSGLRILVTSFRAENAVAGQTANFSFNVINADNVTFDTLYLFLSANPNQLAVPNYAVRLFNLNPGDTATLNNVFPSVVGASVEDASNIATTMQIFVDTTVVLRHLRFQAYAPHLVLSDYKVSGNIMQDSLISATLTIQNQGHADASSTSTLRLLQDENLIAVSPASQDLPALAVGQTTQCAFNLIPSQLARTLNAIPMHSVVTTGPIVSHGGFDIPGGDIENFASGNFSRYDWNDSVNEYPWYVANNVTSGHTARSYNFGNSGHNKSSQLSITYTAQRAGTFEFDYKVSSEANYDFFKFYIDDECLLNESGQMDEWAHASFDVSAGQHTYFFSYKKDGSTSRGSDCVWIDNVLFPFNGSYAAFHTDTLCHFDSSHDDCIVISDSLRMRQHQVDDSLFFNLYWAMGDPQISLFASDTLALHGQEISFAAQGANRYLWSNGSTSDNIAIPITSDTLISVQGFVGNCSDQAQVRVRLHNNPVISISSPDDILSSVALYPNPACDKVTLQGLPVSPSTITLYDPAGRCVERRQVSSSTVQLDLSAFNKGIYLLRIDTPNASTLRKIVKL